MLVYLAISLTGFLGQPGENRAALALAGAVGTITMMAAIYGVVKGAPELWRLDRVWWIALIWIALGVVALPCSRPAARSPTKTAAETRALSRLTPVGEWGGGQGGRRPSSCWQKPSQPSHQSRYSSSPWSRSRAIQPRFPQKYEEIQPRSGFTKRPLPADSVQVQGFCRATTALNPAQSS